MTDSDDLLAHMRRVLAAERDLRDLGVVWQTIESSAAISCPEEVAPLLPTLIQTRERFNGLQTRLIDQMVGENRAALGDELAARAQCAIDILVRNLYERTADVGFLSTDDVVRQFCGASAGDQQSSRAAMLQRLREYQAKYTVYDDVILLGLRGEVLARLDTAAAAAAVCTSSDPVVAEALSSAGYVERFRHSDLAGDAAPALLYAHRITTAEGRPVGVLVLRFRFVDEMRVIFGASGGDAQHLALVLMSDDQRVIASNNDAHVPTGALLSPVPSGEVSLTSFAGREYLAVACASQGYQGYAGPGWRAQAMVSLLTAFRQRADDTEADSEVPLDNADLASIDAEADAINRELRRVVWNGRLMATAQQGDQSRLKAVLNQVNLAGARTRERVDRAIKDLYRTSLVRARKQVGELARMAADIMDRNLYERANDCRWWALSPTLQHVLSNPAEPAGSTALNAVLEHINSLYTVYSRLVVFDADGKVRGLSHADGAERLIGSRIDDAWCSAVRGLGDSQDYAVSPFGPTALHEAGATYVYLAAVRAADASRKHLGGIAIVFNAERELAAMLNDVVGTRAGFAAFVDANGQVLAASDAELARDALIGFAGDQAVVEQGQVHYACARVRTLGYREFKTSDGYDNHVNVVVGLRLGVAERRRSPLSDLPLVALAMAERESAIEVAVFQVGAMRYALSTSALMEAVAVRGLVRTPGVPGPVLGLLEVQGRGQPRLVQVMCARRQFGVTHSPRATDGVVLVLRTPNQPEVPAVGLRVDDVLAVIDVDRRCMHDAPEGFPAFAPWVRGLLDCEVKVDATGGHDRVLVQLLRADRVANHLRGDFVSAASVDSDQVAMAG